MNEYAEALHGACRAACAEIMDAVQAEAELLSSGTATPAQLRADDHPYAQRHGYVQPPYSPTVINEQTSTFRTSWGQEPVAEYPDGFRGAVVNTDPKSAWLEFGTNRMLGRPLPLEVLTNTEARAAEIMQQHIDQALNR